MVLEDGSWVLIRPSVQEPLFRIYVEAGRREQLLSLQKEVLQSLGLARIQAETSVIVNKTQIF